MKPIIQGENLSKRWGDLMLFENISFTVFKGMKVALIARNGTGKTTLLELMAGIDVPDSGTITVSNDVKIGYLKQLPQLNQHHTVIEEIFETDNESLNAIKQFELAVNKNDQALVTETSQRMDELNAWEIEVEIKQILSQLKIGNLEQKISELSGGQLKRLALAKVLVNQPDLLILDEPTNHLDLEMIEWLEKYLSNSNKTLFLVTHDRYFLDRICSEILEMEDNQIYRYKGNYSYFLQKREERLESQKASVLKAKNLLRTEIEWMRRMPKARSHKAKYRIDSFYDLKDKAQHKISDEKVDIRVKSARMGKKIIEIENLAKSYPGVKLFSNFTYKFSRFEKVGIVGKNGSGKSTLLNLITGEAEGDSGKIEIGKTIKFGYYKQSGIDFNSGEKVLEAVTRIAEFIVFEDGTKMSAGQLLNHFLFPPDVQHNYIEKLSGGEQRRLYLCTVLMQNPNFLLLDEPTNDLDLTTLNILEEYLKNFNGCVVVVSHDRFFMDKIVDHLFVLEGDGKISDFPGNYTQYRNYLSATVETATKKVKKNSSASRSTSSGSSVKKLTFAEKRELDQLESELPELEQKIAEIERIIQTGQLAHEDLFNRSSELADLKNELDLKELRWLELSEIGS